MDMDTLAAELSGDPLSRGYAAMTDTAAAADLNTAYRSRTRDTLTSADVYEQIDVAEFQALSASEKTYVRDILSLGGDIAVGPGSKARTVMLGIFGAPSATIVALVAALVVPITRAAELSLGSVKVGHVQQARA